SLALGPDQTASTLNPVVAACSATFSAALGPAAAAAGWAPLGGGPPPPDEPPRSSGNAPLSHAAPADANPARAKRSRRVRRPSLIMTAAPAELPLAPTGADASDRPPCEISRTWRALGAVTPAEPTSSARRDRSASTRPA